MKTTLPIHSEEARQRIALIFGLLAAGIGFFVLAGWALHNDTMKTVFPGMVTMKANTALGLVLCGAATAFLSRGNGSVRLGLCAAVLATLVIVLSGLTLCEYFTNWGIAIDQLLFPDLGDVVGTSGPGRMAPSTAFCFLLTGTTLAMASQPIFCKVRSPVLAAIGATILLIGTAGTLGQLSYGLLHWAFWNFSGMAVHTSLGFVFLGTGMFALITQEQAIHWDLNTTTTVGFVVAVTVMLTVAGYSWNNTYRLEQAAILVGHSNEQLRQIENIRADMANLESGQRGYLITGDTSLIATRDELHAAAHRDISALRGLSADDPIRLQQIDELEQIVTARAKFGDETIRLRSQQGFPAAQALVTTGAGLALTKRINQLLTGMREKEYSHFLARQQEMDATAVSTFLLLPSGIFLSLTILLLALFFLNASLTEEKLTREKLAAAEQASRLLAAIVNSSNDAIVGKDLNSIVTSWNAGAEQLFGYSAGEMIGQSILRLIPSPRRKEEEEIIARIKRGEPVEHFETQRVTKNGQLIDLSMTVSPIKDKDGRIVGASKVARDIAERKQAQQALREAMETISELNVALEKRVAERTAELEATNKELEAFSYSVSHDLRAPLRAVDGFSQAVLEDCSRLLPDQGRKDLETIRAAAQRMGHLIDDLLAFSRLGRLPLKARNVNTCQLVEGVLRELVPQQGGRKVEIMLRELPPCLGDPALLKQVWVNLLSNAIKYTSKSPAAVIEIGARAEGKHTVYYVRDNGAGFDMRYAQKLFGVFQRLHRLDEFEGTGVGLAIVQRVIHRHGGRIWADAKPNYGATFHFTLNGENHE